MAAIEIPPPPVFLAVPGKPPIPFDDWIEMFQTFIDASGAKYDDQRLVSLLKAVLGAVGFFQYKAIREDIVTFSAGYEPKYV